MNTANTRTSMCAVCGELVSAAMSAECNWCDRRFHLNQRNDVDAKDCGRVWIDEQYLALQFACNDCLRGAVSVTDAGGTALGRPATPREAGRRRRYRRRS